MSRETNAIIDDLAILLSLAIPTANEPKSVCDLGCGTGSITKIIGHFTSADVLGIDIQDYWAPTISTQSPNVRFKRGNICEGTSEKLFDIVRAHGLYGHMDVNDFWTGVSKWCRPGGLVLISDGWDASNEHADQFLAMDLLEKGFWPLACVPTGSPRLWRGSNYPGTMLICMRKDHDADLSNHCRDLVDDYNQLYYDAEYYFKAEDVPFITRTYSRYSIDCRNSQALLNRP